MPSFTIDHIHLVSGDATAAAKWYSEVFGAKIIPTAKFPDGRDRAEVDMGGVRLLIRSPRDDKQTGKDSPKSRRGLEHFGLKVDNMEAAVAHIKSKGVEVFDGPKVSMPSGLTVAFVTAPDNVLIELAQYPS